MSRCLQKEMARKMKIYHRWKWCTNYNISNMKHFKQKGKKSLQTLAKSASLKSSLEWSILCNLCLTLQRKSIYYTKEFCLFYKLVDFFAQNHWWWSQIQLLSGRLRQKSSTSPPPHLHIRSWICHSKMITNELVTMVSTTITANC